MYKFTDSFLIGLTSSAGLLDADDRFLYRPKRIYCSESCLFGDDLTFL